MNSLLKSWFLFSFFHFFKIFQAPGQKYFLGSGEEALGKEALCPGWGTTQEPRNPGMSTHATPTPWRPAGSQPIWLRQFWFKKLINWLTPPPPLQKIFEKWKEINWKLKKINWKWKEINWIIEDERKLIENERKFNWKWREMNWKWKEINWKLKEINWKWKEINWKWKEINWKWKEINWQEKLNWK